MTNSQLGSTVESVLSLVEKMTTLLQWDVLLFWWSHCRIYDISHLRSSSLSELAAHTDAIRTEIASVLVVTKKVVEECAIQSINQNIEASLSKMESLSHQLCLVAKVKLKHCQGENMCPQYQVFELPLRPVRGDSCSCWPGWEWSMSVEKCGLSTQGHPHTQWIQWWVWVYNLLSESCCVLVLTCIPYVYVRIFIYTTFPSCCVRCMVC